MLQYLHVFQGSLAAFNCGLQLSWSSPFLSKISKDPRYGISEEEASYFSVIEPATMMITCTLFSILSDTIGRKKTLLIVAIPQLLSWILIATAESVYVFYASRMFAGIADGGMFITLPVYIGEVSSPKVRGTWGNSLLMGLLLGEFSIILMGKYMGVQETAFVSIVLVLVFLILFSLMPESPYLCLMRKRDDDAKQALCFLKWKRDVETDFSSLKSDVQRQMEEQGAWKNLFMIASNRKALIAGIFLRVSQPLGGTLTFVMNPEFIFEKAGVNVNSSLASVIFLAISCFVNFLVVLFSIEKFSRKTIYTISSLFSGIVLVLLAIYFFITEHIKEWNISLPWIPIAGLAIYEVVCSLGMMVIPTLMLGELFSASIKSKGMTVLIVAFGLGVFLANYILFALTRLVGIFGPFLFYGTCCIFTSVFSFQLIPETKGKTLEEIQQSLKGKTIQK
ncbi:facilitated trehalose transporter Tret1 [Leptinotarsa decemlineata]|uniref:facilitated trehalose transporter Tret1 n=1 Tax=Leptinotarsa decemlineata TaxID=7539 RepID=UPI003D30C28B